MFAKIRDTVKSINMLLKSFFFTVLRGLIFHFYFLSTLRCWFIIRVHFGLYNCLYIYILILYRYEWTQSYFLFVSKSYIVNR